MTGGLKKSASKVAYLAAAGLFMGSLMATPAMAADLGGDCCADLEERVAELEATTVRKGNRKVTVTLYGQVNRALLYWNDGDTADVYSVDNDGSSTRIGAKGKAAPVPGFELGYKLEWELQSAASDQVSQFNDDGGDIEFIRTRHAMVYLKTNRGKISLGQTSQPSTGISEIDLSGTKVIATGRGVRWNNAFRVRLGGAVTPITWGSMQAFRGHMGGTRRDLIRYDTPNIMGFTVSAAWGEDDFWDVAVRYAGAFGDFNVAGGVSYRDHDGFENAGGDSEDQGSVPAIRQLLGIVGPGGLAGTGNRFLVGSLAAIHVPTGLNVHAAAGQNYHDDAILGGAATLDDTTFYYIKAGLYKKFLLMGPTGFYGEYYMSEDVNGVSIAGLGNVVSDESRYWGLGVVQHITPAAAEIYIGYRNYDSELSVAIPGLLNVTAEFDQLHMVMGGMRIRF